MEEISLGYKYKCVCRLLYLYPILFGVGINKKNVDAYKDGKMNGKNYHVLEKQLNGGISLHSENISSECNQYSLSSAIEESIIQGKYVEVVDTVDKQGISIVSRCKSISFDSKVCATVPTWSEKDCKSDVSGKIYMMIFPKGYVPEIKLDDTVFKYKHPYHDSPPSLMLIISDTKALYDAWQWYRVHKDDKVPSQKIRDIYKWIPSYGNWHHAGTYRDTHISCIVGMEKVYESILKDIDMLQKRRDIIDKLGMTPSLGYLLISKPGMGKTSIIRAICTHLNIPMHTVTHDALKGFSPENIFSKAKGRTSKESISAYLFEDFDRYLNTAGEEQMASLLNALDGVENMPVSIRFFTSNSFISGKKMEAFLSRMRRTIIIPMHEKDAYIRSIRIVFPSMDEKGVQDITTLFYEKGITMRIANHILCASMISDNPLESISQLMAIGFEHQGKGKKISIENKDDESNSNMGIAFYASE